MITDPDFNPSKISATLISLIIGVIIICSIFIPVVLEIDHTGADHDVQSGMIYRFTPDKGTESTITLSGTAAEYSYWEDGEICVKCPDGTYDLVLTILVQSPGIYEEQEITFWFGDLLPKTLIKVLPVFLIIGLILMILRKMGIVGNNNDRLSYDNY